MYRFDSVPAWSIGSKPKIKPVKGKHPGPGAYESLDFDIRPAQKVTIPKAGKVASKEDNHDIGPGHYYQGQSELSKNGISFKGGKLVSGKV